MVKAMLEFGYCPVIRADQVVTQFLNIRVPVPYHIRRCMVHCAQPEHWELLIGPPSEHVPTPGKRTIYFTMHESTALPEQSVEHLNQAEVVCVPSQWNANCFKASGVTRPIYVVNLGLDMEFWRYQHMPDLTPFIFGVSGRMSHGGSRKGINEAIRLWMKTFDGVRDVRLKVKCFQDDPLEDFEADSRIEVTRKFMSPERFRSWVESIHCFLSMSKGEGWGLIQHQAMVAGRPVITPLFGALEEFIPPDLCYPVKYSLEDGEDYYRRSGYWCVPDEDDTARAMIRACSSREDNVSIGLSASRHASKFDYKRSTSMLMNVMREVGMI